MHKNLLYFFSFIVLWSLQTFLFNNLTLSIYFNPLIYMVFVALLPLETPRGVLLLAGLASGVAADWSMGAAGVNTIATVLVAFLRPMLLNFQLGKENLRDGGVPSPERLGAWGFLRYLLVFVLIHHFVFFALESLSWTHFLHTLLRLAVSSAATIACAWFMAHLITSKFSTRV